MSRLLFSRRFCIKALACSYAALQTMSFMPNVAHAASTTLVLYFSHTGNTRKLANMIHERVNSDILEVTTKIPYPKDHDTVVAQAKREQQNAVRPALAIDLKKLDGYTTIFLGYPNWWGTMPMPLFTLLEQHDFGTAEILPFCTHGGSRLGDSVRDIKKLCPKAHVRKGFAVFGKQVDQAGANLDAWLSSQKIQTKR